MPVPTGPGRRSCECAAMSSSCPSCGGCRVATCRRGNGQRRQARRVGPRQLRRRPGPGQRRGAGRSRDDPRRCTLGHDARSRAPGVRGRHRQRRPRAHDRLPRARGGAGRTAARRRAASACACAGLRPGHRLRPAAGAGAVDWNPFPSAAARRWRSRSGATVRADRSSCGRRTARSRSRVRAACSLRRGARGPNGRCCTRQGRDQLVAAGAGSSPATRPSRTVG